GQTRTDQEAKKDLTATLANIEKRETEERGALKQRQDAERRTEARRMSQNKDRLEKGIRTATERREAENWKPTSPRGTKRTGRPDRIKEAKPAPAPSTKQEPRREATTEPIKGRVEHHPPQPENKPMDAPDLATEKATRGHVLDEFKGDAKRPWQRASLSNDNPRPWQRDDKPAGRERTPSDDKPREPKK
ncbi:hypothetical protein JQV66_20555, partial [Sulfitobacter geojensis]